MSSKNWEVQASDQRSTILDYRKEKEQVSYRDFIAVQNELAEERQKSMRLNVEKQDILKTKDDLIAEHLGKILDLSTYTQELNNKITEAASKESQLNEQISKKESEIVDLIEKTNSQNNQLNNRQAEISNLKISTSLLSMVPRESLEKLVKDGNTLVLSHKNQMGLMNVFPSIQQELKSLEASIRHTSKNNKFEDSYVRLSDIKNKLAVFLLMTKHNFELKDVITEE